MKKILLMLSILLCMILFTACKGTTITSTTRFHSDGSGIRTVSAYISSKDAKKMKLSYEELDRLLEEVAPETVNLSRTMDASNGATYEFSFSFSNIEEYNKKIEAITGETHNGSWYTDASIFKSDITFSERQCTYDLVKWAFLALEKSGYSKFSNKLKFFEIGYNNIYFDDQLVYQESGEGDSPSFTIHTSQNVIKASIYTTYDRNQKLSKQLILDFDKTNFAKLDTELAKSLLNQYSNDFIIDLENGRITLNMDGEKKVRAFLKNADTTYKEANLQYRIEESTPFTYQFVFAENYNLSKFLSNFTLDTEYINNYLSLPEDIRYQNRVFYAPNEVDGKNEEYTFSGKYKVNETYTTNFSADNEVKVSDVHVLYDLKEGYISQIETSFLLKHSDFDIKEDKLKEYYEKKADYVQIDTEGENTKITLTNKYNLDRKIHRQSELSEFYVEKSTLLKKVQVFKSEFQLKDYIPLDIDTNIEYEFKISKKLNLNQLTFNNKKIGLGQNSDTKVNAKDNQNFYDISINESSVKNGKITMTFVNEKSIIPFIVITIIILTMGVLIHISIKDLREDEESTVLDNWVARFKKILE